jgi:hypothetical protein
LIEADTPSDEVTKTKIYTVAIPKNAPYDEKIDRLSECADIVTAVDDSDVFLQAIWIED